MEKRKRTKDWKFYLLFRKKRRHLSLSVTLFLNRLDKQKKDVYKRRTTQEKGGNKEVDNYVSAQWVLDLQQTIIVSDNRQSLVFHSIMCRECAVTRYDKRDERALIRAVPHQSNVSLCSYCPILFLSMDNP